MIHLFHIIRRLAHRKTAEKPFLMAENPAYFQHEVGAYSYGYPKIISWNESTRLSIGRFCSFAGDVEILLGGDHRADWVTTYPFRGMWSNCQDVTDQFRTKGDIIIGNDVWVGQGAMILAGVHIGNGACIAARSVVTKDVPSYSIVGGVPAKVIRYRFGTETIAAIERIAWWNWLDPQIREALPLLLSSSFEDFVRTYDTVTDA